MKRKSAENQIAHTLTPGIRTQSEPRHATTPSHTASCTRPTQWRSKKVGPSAPGQPWSSSKEEAYALAAEHANRELHEKPCLTSSTRRTSGSERVLARTNNRKKVRASRYQRPPTSAANTTAPPMSHAKLGICALLPLANLLQSSTVKHLCIGCEEPRLHEGVRRGWCQSLVGHHGRRERPSATTSRRRWSGTP